MPPKGGERTAAAARARRIARRCAFAGPKVRVEEPEPSFELATPALEFGFDRGWSAPVVTGAEGITNLIRLA